MPKIQVQCPSCASIFNISEEKRGRKIRCTECSTAFVAEVDEDVGEFASSKGGRRTRPSQGRKKSSGLKKRSGGSGTPLAIAGGLGAVGLVVVGLFFAGMFSSKRPPQPVVVEVPLAAVASPSVSTPAVVTNTDQKLLALKWLPAEMDVYVHINVADLLQLQQFNNSIGEMESSQLADVKRMTGLSAEDISSVSLGVVDAMGAWERSERAIAFGQSGTSVLPGVRSKDERAVIVIIAKKAVDIASLQPQIPMAELKERNQHKYVEFPSPHDTSSKLGLWTPDDKTVILGTLPEVQGTIDLGETVTPRPEFANLSSKPTITVATSYKPTATTAQSSQPTASMVFRGLLAEYGIEGMQLAISIRQGFDLELAATCGSSDGAAKLKEAIEGQMGKESPLAAIASLTPAFEQLKPVQEGQSVKLATHLPETFASTAAILPTMITSQVSSKRTSSGSAAAATPSASDDSDSPFIGETRAIEPSEIQGLPPGFKLALRTAWLKTPATDNDQRFTPLTLLCDLQGSDVPKIAGAGAYKILSATTPRGEEVFPFQTAYNNKYQRVLFPVIGKEGTSNFGFVLSLKTPPANTTQLKAVGVQFSCLIATEFDDYVIPNAVKQARSPINDPKLLKAGIKLVPDKSDRWGQSTDILRMTWDPSYSYRSGRVVGPPKSQLQSVMMNLEADETGPFALAWPVPGASKFIGTESLEFQLYRDVKQYDVTVQFKDVPLPAVQAPDPNRPMNNTPTNPLWTAEATLQSRGFDARYLSFSNDGKFLVCGSDDGFVDAWELATNKGLELPGKGGGDPIPVVFHPSSTLVAIANMGDVMRGAGELVLWDFDKQQKIAAIPTGAAMFSLQFNSSGSLLVASQKDRVSFWDVEKLAPQKPDIKLPGVFEARFSPDGTLLATISNKNLVKLWDVATRKEKRSFKLKGRVVDLAFTPDGENLAAAEDGAGIKMWEVSSGMAQRGLELPTVSAIAFSPDGLLVAVGHPDGLLTMWERKTFKPLPGAIEHDERIGTLKFSPDGKKLASGSDDDKVKLWDVTRFQTERPK